MQRALQLTTRLKSKPMCSFCFWFLSLSRHILILASTFSILCLYVSAYLGMAIKQVLFCVCFYDSICELGSKSLVLDKMSNILC